MSEPQAPSKLSAVARKARADALGHQFSGLYLELKKGWQALGEAEAAFNKAKKFLPLIEALGEPTEEWGLEIEALRGMAETAKTASQRAATDALDASNHFAFAPNQPSTASDSPPFI